MICGKAGCGLQYAVKRSGSAVGYCSLSIKCGTKYEGDFHKGTAHFTEHTVFKGTSYKSANVINSYLDKLGGELNAYTTKEEIVFHATVLKEDLRKAGSLLMELASSPIFPEDEIETEKSVVIDEINSYKDSPADDVYDKFEEALFSGGPLGRPILGTKDSVRDITGEELRRFVKENFNPSAMAFTIVADMEEAKLEKLALELISKYFGNTLVSPVKTPEIKNILFPKPFDTTTDKHNHEVNAVLGGLAPSLYGEKKRMAAILMSNILGGPAANSILNNELREKNGWVYGVECSYNQYSDSGVLTVCLGCDRKNLDRCLKAIGKAISRLQEDSLSPTKLKAAKKQLIGQVAISSDNGETQCLSMGKSLLAFGSIASDKENTRKIEAVTAAEIQDITIEILDPGKVSKLIFL
ncbi:MAG: insulinase family protein [Bacteroidales bacterium]|jgi:predicted Zn-dependent peptidase|nr:insulinase family protein [Bacteroidales bacterium]MCI1784598.1 insulinase family protein [Bacteroidales bacterium]